MGFLLTLLVAWLISLRAELGQTQITRRSIFGAKSLPLSEIETALFSSVKGAVFLTVRSPRHWLTFSTYTFSNPQLHQIQDFLVEEASRSSLTIRTSPPPLTKKQVISLTAIYLLVIVIVGASIIVAGVIHSRRLAHRHTDFPNTSSPFR
jgi:hypothetical protein